jgi:hypothetical protein
VSGEIGSVNPGETTPHLVARELIRSGSKTNDAKRILFVIVEENPKPSSLLRVHGQTAVRVLLTKMEQKDVWIYPGVLDYINRHREVLEGAI